MTEERLFTFTQDEVKQILIYQLPISLGEIDPKQVTVVQSGGKTVVRLNLAPPKSEPAYVDRYDEELDDDFDDEDSIDNEEDE
jgi:hypothetical protein